MAVHRGDQTDGQGRTDIPTCPGSRSRYWRASLNRHPPAVPLPWSIGMGTLGQRSDAAVGRLRRDPYADKRN
jgi:hypothetical protein